LRTPSVRTMALSSLSLSLLCRCLHCYPVVIAPVFFVVLFLSPLFTLQPYFHFYPIFVVILFYCHSIYIVTCFIVTPGYIVTPFTLSLHLHCHPVFIAHFRYNFSGIAARLPLLSCFYLPCFHYHSLLVATLPSIPPPPRLQPDRYSSYAILFKQTRLR
jgi:hypothetical protein